LKSTFQVESILIGSRRRREQVVRVRSIPRRSRRISGANAAPNQRARFLARLR